MKVRERRVTAGGHRVVMATHRDVREGGLLVERRLPRNWQAGTGQLNSIDIEVDHSVGRMLLENSYGIIKWSRLIEKDGRVKGVKVLPRSHQVALMVPTLDLRHINKLVLMQVTANHKI